MPNYAQLVQGVRAAFNTGKTRTIEWRRQQLEAILRMLTEKEDELCAALKKDLNKPRSESLVFEVTYSKNDVINCLNNLDQWVAPEKAAKGIAFALDSAYIQREPYGVSLIIGAWNYPVQLVVLPLIGAISAGNCAVVKPSEVAEATAELFTRLIPEYLDQECIKVVTGAVPETTALLEERWDHIMYTGNSTVGKIVYQAAAKHLTPVILELGGKSPVYVDKNSNLYIVARRVVWGKFTNAGQTCVAPDYVMCTKEVQEELVKEMEKAIKEFFGEKPADSADYGRIINERHVARVAKLITGRVAIGGEVDAGKRFIAPTVLADCTPDDPSMKEEIFGPVLPIMPVKDVEEAINYINAGEKPLSMYLFCHDQTVNQRIISSTSSGSVCVNDTILQGALESLPFGGVGNSGIGAYHGKFSFETFSHKRACLVRAQNLEAALSMRYPPFTATKTSRLSWLTKKSLKRKGWFSFLTWFVLGAILAYAFKVNNGWQYLPWKDLQFLK